MGGRSSCSGCLRSPVTASLLAVTCCTAQAGFPCPGLAHSQRLSRQPIPTSLAPPAASPCPQVIPLEELGRPRVDVVVNCSGVFRDLFVNQVGGWVA